MQYMFQAWGARGPAKYRDMLLETGTEEMSHIEMLAHAVALNLEEAPATLQEEIAGSDKMVEAVLGGMNLRHVLSTGLAATPENVNGVPFNMSHIYASGNIVADMLANVTAEASGRVLATRLYNMTNDPGMKDFLSFLIARDTIHQQQWLAVIEELGGLEKCLPIPNSFPKEKEAGEFFYVFLGTMKDGSPPPQGRFTEERSLDGHGTFTTAVAEPHGQEPALGPARPDSGAQKEQMASSIPIRP